MRVVGWRGLCLLWLAAGVAAADGLESASNWIRLKGDLAGAVTYEWVRGTAFAVPEGRESFALFDIESVTVRQVRPLPGGGWEERNYACRLYRDSAGGEYIDAFDNPLSGTRTELTGACNDGFGIRYTASSVDLTADIALSSSSLGVPMQLDIVELGDRLLVRRTSHSRFTPPGASAPRRELSIDSFSVTAVDFRNPDITDLDAVYTWTSRAEWMSSLGLADLPGHMLWIVNGRKYRDVADLPVAFRAALDARVPGALDRQIDWSDFPAD
jgi:hypothetical protein